MRHIEITAIEEAQALFDTNVFGPLWMIRAALPSMRKERNGSIVSISYVVGFLPTPFMGLYSSPKYAIEGLSIDHDVRDYSIGSWWCSTREQTKVRHQ